MQRAEFKCPKCRASVLAPPALAGESSPCPKCGADVERWPAATLLISGPGMPPSPPRNEAVWHYLVNDHQHGPVTDSQIRALVEAGKLRAADLVWRDGLPDWMELQSVPEFMPQSLVKPPQPKSKVAVEVEDDEPKTMDCPFCATAIPARAKVCRECGETVDVALRAAEEAKREAKDAKRKRSERVKCHNCGSTDPPMIRRKTSAAGVVVMCISLCMGFCMFILGFFTCIGFFIAPFFLLGLLGLLITEEYLQCPDCGYREAYF